MSFADQVDRELERRRKADAEIAALRAERDTLRARVEALESGLREIENWAPNWARGVDENVDAIRARARALREKS